MKKFLLVLLAITAVVLFLSNLGPMILLALSLAVSYYAVKKFILTNSLAAKAGWGIVILIGLSLSLSNLPALVGAIAFVVLYYVYKAWKRDKEEDLEDEVFGKTSESWSSSY